MIYKVVGLPFRAIPIAMYLVFVGVLTVIDPRTPKELSKEFAKDGETFWGQLGYILWNGWKIE